MWFFLSDDFSKLIFFSMIFSLSLIFPSWYFHLIFGEFDIFFVDIFSYVWWIWFFLVDFFSYLWFFHFSLAITPTPMRGRVVWFLKLKWARQLLARPYRSCFGRCCVSSRIRFLRDSEARLKQFTAFSCSRFNRTTVFSCKNRYTVSSIISVLRAASLATKAKGYLQINSEDTNHRSRCMEI